MTLKKPANPACEPGASATGLRRSHTNSYSSPSLTLWVQISYSCFGHNEPSAQPASKTGNTARPLHHKSASCSEGTRLVSREGSAKVTDSKTLSARHENNDKLARRVASDNQTAKHAANGANANPAKATTSSVGAPATGELFDSRVPHGSS